MFQLKTKRLLLRHIQDTDIEALHRQIFRDAEVMRFGDGRQTRDAVKAWMNACVESYEKHGFGPYVITELNKVIGYCGLFYFPDVNGKPEVEIGYRLAYSKWGRGFATESACAVRDFAFDSLHLESLIAMIDPENIASIHVVEKLGMQYESEVIFWGYTHPDRVYRITRNK